MTGEPSRRAATLLAAALLPAALLGGCSARSELKLSDSLITGNRDVAVMIFGSTATIDGVLVKDTRPRESDSGSGWGSIATKSGFSTSLLLRDSLVDRSRSGGLSARCPRSRRRRRRHQNLRSDWNQPRGAI